MDTKDRFGACVVCHRNLLIEQAVDGRVMVIWHPDKDETTFLLHDGSIMPVSICRICKTSIDFTSKLVQDKIMNSVIEGWQHQVTQLVANEQRPDWTKERAKSYMDTHSQYKIHCHKGL